MKNLLKIILLLLISSSAYSQQHKIFGKVTSADDGSPLPGVNVLLKGTSIGTITDVNGEYEILTINNRGILIFSFVGLKNVEEQINGRKEINVAMESEKIQLQEVVVTNQIKGRVAGVQLSESKILAAPMGYEMDFDASYPEYNTEEYATIHENNFVSPADHPLSTFSIDVDNASYANLRRFLNHGQKPPVDAVRIEEMVNYFNYTYPEPSDDRPFAVNTELSYAPWNKKHMLLKIGLKAKDIPLENLPSNNLVFLIDVSGSMQSADKLPLLKESFKMLIDKMRPDDQISIVVYAGAAGMVLPPTKGIEKDKIKAALAKLEAGGSTAGGQGLELAYKVAKENFLVNGNNRIVLATDGDFNVGPSSNAEMERMIEKKRNEGIYLTVLGYGMGNYKDSKMEILANKGNGNYGYIDNLREAQKMLVDQMAGTLLTVAKDVKLQLEFNPEHVHSYRLIGYENRKLNKEDFNNDKKDAGEMGAGHTVTALYEIVPAGAEMDLPKVDDLKYQKQIIDFKKSNELLTLKIRYKKPDEESSIKFEQVVLKKPQYEMSEDFRWACAVAGFGMLLRESDHINEFTFDEVLQLARSARGNDENGFRIEFINMIQMGRTIAAN